MAVSGAIIFSFLLLPELAGSYVLGQPGPVLDGAYGISGQYYYFP